jgi:iron complex outermembrane recepter protein
MKTLIHCLLGLVCLFCLTANTQISQGRISRQVIDAVDQPFTSATAALRHAADYSLIKVAATDKKGYFEFESLLNGRCLVLLTAVGHQKRCSQHFILNATGHIQIPVIPLQKTTVKNLGGVT